MTKRQGKFLMGIDPGLRNMGWGIIDVVGSRIHHVANGNLTSQANKSLGERLACLYKGLEAVLADYRPDGVAVEKTFVSKDPVSTLKLGQARGVAVLVPALASLPVAEYAPNVIKKSLVGAGHADKQQIRVMVGALLPTCEIASDDAADALAVAICHAHHSATAERILTAVHGDALKARQKRSITS